MVYKFNLSGGGVAVKEVVVVWVDSANGFERLREGGLDKGSLPDSGVRFCV